VGASMPGGGKSANYELNLVPFIDLFSTLICFLLITAAWQSMETINTGAPPKSVQNIEDDSPPPPPDPVKKVALTVTLFVDRLDVGEDNSIRSIPHVQGTPDYNALGNILNEWKRKYPDRKDLVLATENRAPYKHLVKLMDVFIERKFPEVGITLN
jgi:biopolymer transport protein ExbD